MKHPPPSTGQITATSSSAPPAGTSDATAQQALKCQQLRRREPVHGQPVVAADPDRPLLEEPVGGRLGLGEHLLGASGDGEPLGEGVHYVCPGEGGHLSGQSVRTGQRGQRGVQLCPGR
jgi:hypothetical protein